MTPARHQGWPLDPEHLAESYPWEGSVEARLRHLVRYAILAPSSHDAQPWRFRIRENAISLRVDPMRRLPVADPDGREMVASCGAALRFLRFAIRHFGHEDEVVLQPDPEDVEFVARVRLGEPRPPEQRLEGLFHSILRRRTARLDFEDTAIPLPLPVALGRAAAEEGATLVAVPRARREVVADLVSEAVRAQLGDRAFRREVARWIRSDDTRARATFGFANVLPTTGGLGEAEAERQRRFVLDAPFLAVLATEADDREDWITAGQALGHVVLRAAQEDVHAGYVNSAVQVPETRQRLEDALGLVDAPQVLLRFGFAPTTPRMPRRGPSGVLS